MSDEQYPRGKLRDDDEGALDIAVTVIDKTVIVDFGKPVTWLGLAKHDALAIAALLTKRANEIKP